MFEGSGELIDLDAATRQPVQVTARGGVIYNQRREGGKRIRFSCKTNDWEEAVAVARLHEERKGIGSGRTLDELARRGQFGGGRQ